MKVTITQLKAPWHEGAALGDVVEVPGDDIKGIPGSLVGKCAPAGDDAQACATWAPIPPPPVTSETRIAAPGEDAAVKAENEQLKAELAKLAAENEQLKAKSKK